MGEYEEELTIEGDEEAEGQAAKVIRAPIRPSQQEVDEHMLTHIPFRSWCPHCVKGKAVNSPHLRTKE